MPEETRQLDRPPKPIVKPAKPMKPIVAKPSPAPVKPQKDTLFQRALRAVTGKKKKRRRNQKDP